jgi:hypothetical protein
MIEIDLRRASVYYGIDYFVFPTSTDALGFLTDDLGTRRALGFRIQHPVPGFPKASLISQSLLEPTTGGCVGVDVLVDTSNVVLNAKSRPYTTSGNCPVSATLTLARFALQHLRAVEAGLR